MKRLAACALLGGFFATGVSAATPLVVTHATLWTEQGLQPDHELAVKDGRVAALGTSGRLVRPAGAKVIDAQGDTLLPGLIDSHVHLVLGAPLPKDMAATAIYPLTARQLLRSGVTAGRIHLMNLEEGPRLKRTAAGDAEPWPRLFLGGPGLFGGQPAWENPRGNAWGVKSAEDAAAKVRRIREAGGDWIALHDLAKFQPGEAEAIVAEARRLGVGLMVGGDKIAEVARGVALGVDTVEYLDFSATARYPDDLLAQMQARGPALFCVPPIGYNHRAMAYWRGTLNLDDPRLVQFFPPAIAEAALTGLRENQTKPGATLRRLEAAFPTLPDKFRQLRAAGLQVAIGTDCGSEANFQADAIWWEMETWRQLGVSPHEIVRAATTVPATLLRQPDLGHLRPGARGDFLLYRGDLARDTLSVQRVRAVAKGGNLFVDEGEWVGP